MAAKKSNWGAILGIAAIAAAVYLLWPRKAAAAGSGGGGGPVGAMGGLGPKLPIQKPTAGGVGGPVGGPAGGAGGLGGPSLQQQFKNWLNGQLNQDRQAIGAYYTDVSGQLSSSIDQIASQPLQQFDVSQLAYTPPSASDLGYTDPTSALNNYQIPLYPTQDYSGANNLTFFPDYSIATTPTDQWVQQQQDLTPVSVDAGSIPYQGTYQDFNFNQTYPT